MDTQSAARAVHFSQSCVLILDHELTVPSLSPSGATGAIFRAFNPIAKGFALHLPSTLGGRGAHARRSSSTESSALQVADDSPGATSPRLGRRVSGARKNSLTAYPSVQLPLRSCLKTPQRDIPPTPISPTVPGSFNHSPPPSPVHVRGRSMSRSSPPPNSVSTSPPPAPAHHLCIPTEIIPLQPCCDTCNEVTDLAYSMGNSYRISWSPAAAAKKKRDDAEERGDILAGLKRACNYKWNKMMDGADGEDEGDDGFGGPLSDESDECPGLHATSCPPGSAAALDPLSKLDGLSRSPAASTSSLNKDWTPDKYYDSEDEDQDLFPLPSPSMSPQPSPLTGSPASSATHLPSSTRPISPLVNTHNGYPPVCRSHFHGQPSLGLPPIAGSAPASPAAGSARSSVVSLSDAGSGRSRGSVQSHHSRGPSPIHVVASTNAARQHLDAPSIATASTGSSSRTGSSGRMWTTSFVPPPLPTRKDLQGRKLVGAEGTSKSPLLASGSSSKSTNLNTTAASKLKGERDRGERANPPPMPTYSGAQREIMIVASSKDRERERERERGSASQQPKQRTKESGDKPLPLPPLIRNPASTQSSDNTPDSTPSGSRSGSVARRNAGSPYYDDCEDAMVDLSLSRVPTATVLNTPKSARSQYGAQEDDQLGPLTSPVTSPAKARRGGSISQQQQQQPTPPRTVLKRALSGQNLKINTSSRPSALEEAVAAAASSREGRQHRRSSTADVVDESGVLVTPSRTGGGDSNRNRASSIKRLWKGIGSITSGIGAAAGAV